MRLPAVLATASLLALAGCGQAAAPVDRFQGAEREVAEKVADLADAGRRREAAEICGSVIATSLREEIVEAGADCESEMRKAIEDADDFELEVTDVTVTGAKATARVRGGDRGEDVTRTFRLVREDGGWRIAAFQ